MNWVRIRCIAASGSLQRDLSIPRGWDYLCRKEFTKKRKCRAKFRRNSLLHIYLKRKFGFASSIQFFLNSWKVSVLGSEGLWQTVFVFSQLESPLHLGLALLVGGLFLSTVVTHSGNQFGQKEVSEFSCNLKWCILSDTEAVVCLRFACVLWFVSVKFHCVWG